MQLVVGVNDSQVNFVGTNYSGEATTPQLCNCALGIFDKETRVLKMVPIAANRDMKFDTLRQTEESGTQQGLDNKLKEIKINAGAFEAIASTTNVRNAPPYDLAATASDMAYPLFKIILKWEWDYLLDVFELAQAASEANPDIYPSLFATEYTNWNLLRMNQRKGGWLAYCHISLISSFQG